MFALPKTTDAQHYATAWKRLRTAVQVRQEEDTEAKDTPFEQVDLKTFYKTCKAGDVMLIREKVEIIPRVYVPASVARQVVTSTTSGNFSGEKRGQVPTWTRGGVICLHDGSKAMIEATPTGVEVRPLKEILKGLRASQAIVAVRSLRAPNKAFFAAQLQPFLDCCMEDMGVVWSTILVEKRKGIQEQQSQEQQLLRRSQRLFSASGTQQLAQVSKEQEGDWLVPVATPLGAPTSAIIIPELDIGTREGFTETILSGVKKQVLKVHPSMEYEALHAFYQLDMSGRGELDLENAVKAFEVLVHNATARRNDADRIVKYMLERAESLLEDVTTKKKEACTRRTKTGEAVTVVRFEEFLEVFRALPLLYVPYQHDIQGILAGQAVTAVYRFLHVVSEDAKELETICIGDYSSLGSREVVLDVDHLFEREVMCTVK